MNMKACIRSVVLFLGVLMVASSGCAPVVIQSSDSILIQAGPSANTRLSLESIIRPYRDSVSKEMDQIIGNSLVSMEKGKPESLLGNFISDICMNRINDSLASAGLPLLDLFVFNLGGLRGVIPQGPIKKGDIFQVMPFDNELVWVEISHDSLLSLMGYISQRGGAPVSGLIMSIKDLNSQEVRLINGKPIVPGEIYRIGTNDFLANGGDGMTMLSSQNGTHSIGIKVRDAIIDQIQVVQSRNGSIDSKLDMRIHGK